MTADFPIVIYHNPDCGTSRNVLAMIEAAGYEPQVIEYLKVGWSEALLRDLLAAMSAHSRDILREKGTPAEALGLTAPDVGNEAILAAMVEHPVLVNRPIVKTPLGVRLCRPSEAVLDLLADKPATFTKEDGEVVTL